MERKIVAMHFLRLLAISGLLLYSPLSVGDASESADAILDKVAECYPLTFNGHNLFNFQEWLKKDRLSPREQELSLINMTLAVQGAGDNPSLNELALLMSKKADNPEGYLEVFNKGKLQATLRRDLDDIISAKIYKQEFKQWHRALHDYQNSLNCLNSVNK